MKKTAFFTLCVLALSLFSCGDMLSDDSKGSADSEEVYIVIDGLDDSNEAIVGTWLYVRLSNNEDAEWSTSNADIASLSYYDYPFDSYNKYMTATVILRSEGSVKITAKTSAGEYHYTLDVRDRIIVSIYYEDPYDYDTVEVGGKLQFRMASYGWVEEWSVSDESKASLSVTSGYSTSLTAKSAGSVTVSAKTSLNEYSYTIQITFSKNVQFNNLTDYKVTVRRDGLEGEIVAEILSGLNWTGYVAPTNKETVFYFSYSTKVIEDSDYGTVWVDMEESKPHTHTVDSIDLEKKLIPIEVPLPNDFEFTATYLKIYNDSKFPFSLYRTNTQIETIRRTLNVQPQTWGVYKVMPSDGELTLMTSDSRIPIEELPAQNGIYECTLYDYTQSLKPVLHPVDSSDLENSDFTVTYLKIYNDSKFPFSLYRTNTQIETIWGTFNVQPQTWGVYKVMPSDGKLTDFTLMTSDNRIIPIIEDGVLPAQNGIYECTLYDYTQSLKPVLRN